MKDGSIIGFTSTSSLLETIGNLLCARSPRAGATRIIAIDGCGGSGKSTLAGLLAALLVSQGERVSVVHTDDFASWDCPLEWWPRLVAQVLEPLSRCEVARYQAYNWERRALADWHEVSPGGLLILEGVSSSRREFREFLSYSIWIDCPAEERLRRGLARDGEGALGLWQEWMKAEDEYVERDRPHEFADLVLDDGADLVLDDGFVIRKGSRQ